jgi:Tol biopolymer transport system component
MMKRALLIGLLVVSLTSGTVGELIKLFSMITPVGSISPQASAIATASVPVQLTTGGCCTQPFWSPDGKQVRYIDKPAGGKLGIYGVPVQSPAPPSALVSERVEDSRIEGPYRIETSKTTTTLVRLSDGKKFAVPAQGRSVQFSPDLKRIAWGISNQDLPPEQQVAAIWVANVDGSAAKRVTTLRRGGVSGWISDNALLVNGQDPKNPAVQVLSSLSLADGKLKEIVRAERLRSATLSPSGKWIAYYTAFNESGNGLWLVDTSGGKPKAAPAGAFGAYQWRPTTGGDKLVIIPFKPDAQYHEFWQLNPESLALVQLTKAAEAPLKIANGDWRVSPDGRYVAFVESKDRNIWVVEMPSGG